MLSGGSAAHAATTQTGGGQTQSALRRIPFRERSKQAKVLCGRAGRMAVSAGGLVSDNEGMKGEDSILLLNLGAGQVSTLFTW